MLFIVKYIRPIWSNFFKLIFWVITFINNFNEIKRLNYEINKDIWNNLKDVADLNFYFKNNYKYNWDGIYGILDHDNSKLEFLSTFGDCDDMGKFSELKLKELGYQAWRIFIEGKNIFSNHFDCIFKNKDSYYLFNYGDNKILDTTNLKSSTLDILNKMYENSTMKFLNKDYPIGFSNWFYLD